MLITEFPANCTLLEWSTDQQDMHLNDVKKGIPKIRPNTYGYLTVYICQSHDEAMLITQHLAKYLIKDSKNGKAKALTAYQINRHIKAITKFATAYIKLKNKKNV